MPSRRKTSVGHSLTPNERPPRTILDADVDHGRVGGERRGNDRRSCAADAAPRRAEINDSRPLQRIDIGAGKIARRIAGRRGRRITPHRESDRPSAAGVRMCTAPGERRRPDCYTMLPGADKSRIDSHGRSLLRLYPAERLHRPTRTTVAVATPCQEEISRAMRSQRFDGCDLRHEHSSPECSIR